MWDDFVLFVAVGFAAQMVDGAVGMAYGVSATTVMLSFGILLPQPAPASMPPRFLPRAYRDCPTGVLATCNGRLSRNWLSPE
jgi:hypothetical protein